jgi:hypothetical protein
MFRRALYVGTALACWATVGGANPLWAQNPAPRQDTPRQERRDDRRDERRGTETPAPAQPGQPAQAQPRQGTQTQSQYADSRSPQTHRVRSVLGTKVSIQGNLAIGTVDDIIFDDDGYIDYLVVNNEGKYVVVPWQAAKFNFEQRAATVNITQQQFQQVPTYTQQQLPTVNFFEPAYQQRIYGYYGIRPGPERRIERRDNRRGP